MSTGTTTTRWFSRRQLSGLRTLGDVMLPEEDGEPSFSRLGCEARADSVVEHLPDGDRRDLLLLFGILGMLPAALVAAIVRIAARGSGWKGPVGDLCRLVSLALKGIVMTLYYSHPTVHEQLGYEVKVVTDDRGEIVVGAAADSGTQPKVQPSPR